MNKWIYFENEALNLANAHSILFVKEEYERVYSVIIKTSIKEVIWEFEQKDMSDDEFEKDFQQTKASIINFTGNKDSLVMILD